MPKLQVPKTSTMWQMSAAASQPASLYAFLPLNRHAETYDEPLNITKHTATKISNPVTRCQRVKKMPRRASHCHHQSNRKINDERILPLRFVLRAGSCSYLRCNRSVDENFLPGVRGAFGAAAAVPAAAGAALVAADAIALRRAEAAVVDESSFVSSVSLVAKAAGDDDSDVFRFADRMESSSADSDAGGGSNPVGDGCDATAATAAARIGLPPLLRGENTRAAAAAIRASLDWRSWIAISWGTMALPSPSPLSGGGGSFILVPLLHRLSYSRIVV